MEEHMHRFAGAKQTIVGWCPECDLTENAYLEAEFGKLRAELDRVTAQRDNLAHNFEQLAKVALRYRDALEAIVDQGSFGTMPGQEAKDIARRVLDSQETT